MRETPKIEKSENKTESKESIIQFFREASEKLGFIENKELKDLHIKILENPNDIEKLRTAFIEWADKARSLEIFNEEDITICGKAQLGLNLMQISIYMELGIENEYATDINDIADQAFMLGEEELTKKIESILK